MGCASSAPFMGGPGGLIGAAKNAASGVVEAGEGALHDVGESISETVEHVKQTVAHAVHNVGSTIEGGGGVSTNTPVEGVKEAVDGLNAISEGDRIIPLHGEPAINMADSIGDDVTSMKDGLIKSATNFTSEADNMADELMKETQDVADDLAGKSKDFITSSEQTVKNEMSKAVDNLNSGAETVAQNVKNLKEDMSKKTKDLFNSSNKALSDDSLKFESLEPEIQRIMEQDVTSKSPTPEATMSDIQVKNNEQEKGNPFEMDEDTSTPLDKLPLASTSASCTPWEALADAILELPPPPRLSAIDYTRIKTHLAATEEEDVHPFVPETQLLYEDVKD